MILQIKAGFTGKAYNTIACSLLKIIKIKILPLCRNNDLYLEKRSKVKSPSTPPLYYEQGGTKRKRGWKGAETPPFLACEHSCLGYINLFLTLLFARMFISDFNIGSQQKVLASSVREVRYSIFFLQSKVCLL